MRIILILAAAVFVVGCGSDGEEGAEVVATTAIAGDITRNVAGDAAEVEILLPGGASPHDYGASAKDRAKLDDADVVVAWGAGLEAGLPLDDASVELAAGQRDPHVWMDPTLVARELPELADALASADPDGAAGYRARARAYAKELEALDRELRDTLASVPEERRKLVTSHDSLGHFARRYDLEFVGAPFGLAPESEPSAEKVAELIERVEREDVRAVFAEESDDPEQIEEIAREAEVEVVDDLLVEGFGDQVESYEEMLRHDARRIAEALRG